MLFWYRF